MVRLSWIQAFSIFLSVILSMMYGSDAVPVDPHDAASLTAFKNAVGNGYWPCGAPGVYCWVGGCTLESWNTSNDCSTWNRIQCDSHGRVTNLDMGYCDLQGVIPSDLANLTALSFLNLCTNKLHGTIPPGLGSLRSLTYLCLGTNQLNGTLPPELGNLASLRQAYFDNNFFTGMIPTSFGNLNLLQTLQLSNNSLVGSIPSSMTNLQSLETLLLSANYLTGNVPDGLFSLPCLYVLHLDNNYLSGSFPVCFGGDFQYGQNCLALPANYSCPDTGPVSQHAQRTASVCDAHCSARQPGGSCGGQGTCVQKSTGSSSTWQCTCAQGYQLQAATSTCRFALNTTGLAPPQSTTSKYLSRKFTYGSVGIDWFASTGQPTWLGYYRLSWRDIFTNWPIKLQGTCSACWAFSAVATAEAAYAIATNRAQPLLFSEEQLVDCTPYTNCTSGGWPGSGYDYAATYGLLSANMYPWSGAATASRKCLQSKFQSAPSVPIARYEEVNFYGWVGLMLAVQQQPVLVLIQASYPTFTAYDGSDTYNDPNCFSSGVDHTVVVVGFDLLASPPFWVIRNSWGDTWGDQGYMKLAIAGGDGICGINTMPAYYPVVHTSNDPCHLNALKRTYMDAGPLNPCGGGQCIVTGAATYTCTCRPRFIQTANIDGTAVCVPAEPCSLFARNPCTFGSCINSNDGNYTCICPIGYVLSSLSSDGSPTCISANEISGASGHPATYVVPAGFTVSCYDVYILYGIDPNTFMRNNPNLKCNSNIPGGTVVNIPLTASRNCSLWYPSVAGDTCWSISALFGIPVASFTGPGSPNPGLDGSCSQLVPGQQVCIESGPPPAPQVCTSQHLMSESETCLSVIGNYFKGSVSSFFSLNPDIFCNRIFADGTPVAAEPVCLSATDPGTVNSNCKGATKQLVTIQPWDTCLSIMHEHFQHFSFLQTFKDYNQQIPCSKNFLVQGRRICVPR